MKKNNGGFTLVELLATIAATSIVTLAAMSFLLVCFRLCAAARITAGEQDASRIVLTLMEELASSGKVKKVANDGSKLYGDGIDNVLLAYDSDNHTLTSGSASDAPIMEGVKEFEVDVDVDGKLLTITLKTENGKEYKTSVYCRIGTVSAPAGGGGAGGAPGLPAPAAYNLNAVMVGQVNGAPEDAQSYGISNDEWIARCALVSNLNLQTGSTGEILSGGDEGKYFSEWYIGGYGAAHPGWNKDTPWCACFVSWGIAQVAGSLDDPPSFADVDVAVRRLRSGEYGDWLSADAPVIPGDLVFFDFDEEPNPDYDSAAEHMGVVLTQQDGRVYTVEGNVNGEVVVRNYDPDDPRILGYGRLKWNSSGED